MMHIKSVGMNILIAYMMKHVKSAEQLIYKVLWNLQFHVQTDFAQNYTEIRIQS